MKKEELVIQIENLIKEIIENAVEHFTSDLDEGVIEDWKNGYRNDKCRQHGQYITYSDFISLYDNFRYDLELTDKKTLNYIKNFLTDEKNYVDYRDLDKDLNNIDDFEYLAINE